MQDSNLIRIFDNILNRFKNISTITLRPSSESAKANNETEISYEASCIFDDAMAEYSATQILNSVVNDTKATTERMISGNRLSDKKTCERLETELGGDNNYKDLYILSRILSTGTSTGRLNMQGVEIFVCVMELIDDIRKNRKDKQSIQLPAHSMLCDIFVKVISETKPSFGAVYGDRQVETWDDKTGDETWLAKNIKVIFGIAAYIILHYSNVEEFENDASDLDEYCRGLNSNLCHEIKSRYMAMGNDREKVKMASRNYVEGNSYLSHYLLSGGKDAAGSETLSDDESKRKLSPEFVELAFSPLKEARCKEGWPVIDAKPFKIVIQNFCNWYNEGHNLNIKRIVTKGTVSGLIKNCKTIWKNINGKNHRLTINDFEMFLKAQFDALKNRKKPFLTH